MGSIRKTLTALALAGAAVTSVVSVATPASAAGAVSFCFTFANPPTHSTYANRPVYLYQQLPHGWEIMSRGYTRADGCGTFYGTPTGNRLAVRAYIATAYQTWDGWSAIAPTGPQGNYLGRNMVYRTR